MWPNPKPIDTAPRSQDSDNPLLLWCPDQGGWHTGLWLESRWVGALTLRDPLAPTYWLEPPPDPQFAASKFELLAPRLPTRDRRTS
jgi:hypothetical protein